jgi:hypothetical protein
MFTKENNKGFAESLASVAVNSDRRIHNSHMVAISFLPQDVKEA